MSAFWMVSLVIDGANSVVLPGLYNVNTFAAIWVTFALGAGWLLVLIAAMIIHRGQGCVLILSAPFALFWPTVLGVLFLAG